MPWAPDMFERGLYVPCPYARMHRRRFLCAINENGNGKATLVLRDCAGGAGGREVLKRRHGDGDGLSVAVADGDAEVLDAGAFRGCFSVAVELRCTSAVVPLK